MRLQTYVERRIIISFTFLLFVNILEVVIFDLLAGNTLNAVLLGITALLTPLKWVYNDDETAIGFRDPAWCIAASTGLGYTYFFNPEFYDIALPVQLILLITFIGIWLKRDWLYWVVYRLFYLVVLVVVDSIFPQFFRQNLYPPFFHPENRMLFHGTSLEFVWLAAGIIAVGVLLVVRFRAYFPRFAGRVAYIDLADKSS